MKCIVITWSLHLISHCICLSNYFLQGKSIRFPSVHMERRISVWFGLVVVWRGGERVMVSVASKLPRCVTLWHQVPYPKLTVIGASPGKKYQVGKQKSWGTSAWGGNIMTNLQSWWTFFSLFSIPFPIPYWLHSLTGKWNLL